MQHGGCDRDAWPWCVDDKREKGPGSPRFDQEGAGVGSALAHTRRFDTATPAVNPVLMRRVELPGGWNLDDYNTTQARPSAHCHA